MLYFAKNSLQKPTYATDLMIINYYRNITVIVLGQFCLYVCCPHPRPDEDEIEIVKPKP